MDRLDTDDERMYRVRVASPCSVSWQEMEGDARVRLCSLCKLNVFNFSEMSREEIGVVLKETTGGLCVRVFQRADGTFLTRDCPTGIRALRHRVARIATSALTALLTLTACALGRTGKGRLDQGSPAIAVSTVASPTSPLALLEGIVVDELGAALPGAAVDITDELSGKSIRRYSDANGAFTMSQASGALLTLKVHLPGLVGGRAQHLQLTPGKVVNVRVSMRLEEGVRIIVGAVAPLINVTDSSTTTTISREMIERLPH